MIVVYEPFCKGWNHVPINSDLILIISERFPNDEIFFYGEQDHLKHVRDRINNPSLLINYCNIDIVNISQGRINSVINERKNCSGQAKKAMSG
ncbi:hypothetical protein [Treponema bryantii]|uniref:hypothetical protein n=1 Tax=Treponema bryantii TaxID=163 RepID=UPI0003B54B26|nr:hypothetical protein [Treponema bryantii]